MNYPYNKDFNINLLRNCIYRISQNFWCVKLAFIFFIFFIVSFVPVYSYALPATPTGTSPGSTSSPGPTMSSTTVSLSWSSVSGATYYGLGVRDIATGVLVVDTNVSGTSYSASLVSGKQYRWLLQLHHTSVFPDTRGNPCSNYK